MHVYSIYTTTTVGIFDGESLRSSHQGVVRVLPVGAVGVLDSYNTHFEVRASCWRRLWICSNRFVPTIDNSSLISSRRLENFVLNHIW
jgi:hypothetical protein